MNMRAMLADDIPLLASWIVTIPLWQRYRLTTESISARMAAGLAQGDLMLTVDNGDRACGFAWCIREGAFGRSAYLRLIGVRPDKARSGVGTRLLSYVEQSISSSDLFLLVADFNTAAQQFYQRRGYEQVGAIPAYVLPDVTELIYRKRVR